MVNLKNLSKAELQATGFNNVSTARNFIKLALAVVNGGGLCYEWTALGT